MTEMLARQRSIKVCQVLCLILLLLGKLINIAYLIEPSSKQENTYDSCCYSLHGTKTKFRRMCNLNNLILSYKDSTIAQRQSFSVNQPITSLQRKSAAFDESSHLNSILYTHQPEGSLY